MENNSDSLKCLVCPVVFDQDSKEHVGNLTETFFGYESQPFLTQSFSLMSGITNTLEVIQTYEPTSSSINIIEQSNHDFQESEK